VLILLYTALTFGGGLIAAALIRRYDTPRRQADEYEI
jgi:hypothetical protein